MRDQGRRGVFSGIRFIEPRHVVNGASRVCRRFFRPRRQSQGDRIKNSASCSRNSDLRLPRLFFAWLV